LIFINYKETELVQS